MRFTAVGDDVVGREPSAWLQHAPDLLVKPCAVGDVHGHVLQQDGVEAAAVEGQFEGAGGLERHLLALPGALGEIARGIHKRFAQVDPRDPAANRRGQKAGRPAHA